MSRSYQLAEAYRQQRDAEISRLRRCMGPDLVDSTKVALSKRAAYWKASRKINQKIFPRGKNFVLIFEGMV